MCTIENIPELIDAGIDSFKIEGRMKKPEYAAGVPLFIGNILINIMRSPGKSFPFQGKTFIGYPAFIFAANGRTAIIINITAKKW